MVGMTQTLIEIGQAQDQALSSEGPAVERDLTRAQRRLFGLIVKTAAAEGVDVENSDLARFLPHDWRRRAL